ncbi:MAG: hypothetical protein HY304_07770 [candidate division Zixibacteria bacterium]|nr:hypothetical protein [candidate division Zixibacteria bacterium]
MASSLEDSCWPGWSTAPRAILLVTDSTEFLTNHPAPSSEFKSSGRDSTLHCDVFWRKRVFPLQLEATFPALGPTPTIVIGRAENTVSKTSTKWVVTLMHEHFHQLQDSRPGYYASVDSLNLSGGDKTGMWMLNYPFPYDSQTVAAEFNGLCAELLRLLNTGGPDSLHAGARQYWKRRESFRRMLGPADRSYFSFQTWQEGIARYVEYRCASMAGGRYRPSDAFRSLPDFTAFAAVAERIRSGVMSELAGANLKQRRRELFYPFGAGEGLLLDRINPEWRNQYLATRFQLEPLFPSWVHDQ